MKKALKIAGQTLLCLLIFLSVLVSTAIFWMLKTWPNTNVDEIRYHMQAPKTGTDPAIIKGCINQCVIPTIIFTLISVFVIVIWKKRKQIYGYLILAVSLCTAIFSVKHVWDKLDIGTYLENASMYSTFIDDHYVYPSSVQITFPEQKRNLIYIFLESMETTFADRPSGGAFEENMIPNLTELALENENFNGSGSVLNGGVVLNKTTYTMGGIYGESMGIPLILPFGGNAMSSQESFMTELDGIGDVLEAAGYRNNFLIGSEAAFGGRDLFYRDHGNYRILDYNYALKNQEIPKDYHVFWGYEDAKLFEIAKKYVLEEAASGEPFNMTMLTVDTHFEDGYVCDDCEPLHGKNVYADVYNCSDRKVAEFVAWVQEQDFYENTTIVLVGDHLTMDSDFCKDVDETYERKVYMTIINGAAAPENDTMRQYTTLDMFPTTLAALGAEIEGERLGLGTNLYSSKPTLLEQYGEAEMNIAFDRKSVMMEHLGETVDMDKFEEIYKDEWYYEAVEFVFNHGIMRKDDFEFAPEENITKALAVQALYNLEGQPAVTDRSACNELADVKKQWYTDAVCWAYANGIVTGDLQENEFNGNDHITREQLALMLYRYVEYKQLDASATSQLEGLKNSDKVSPWADAAIRWAVGSDLLRGEGNVDLAPQGNATQAQAATIFMRLCRLYDLVTEE